MKIDVFWVWFIAFFAALLFQNFFTVKKSVFDVSYVYTSNSKDTVSFGQAALSGAGDILTFHDAKTFVKQCLDMEQKSFAPVDVVVLSVKSRTTDRYWRPFWHRF